MRRGGERRGRQGRSRGAQSLRRFLAALAAASTLGVLLPALGQAAVVQVIGADLRIDGYPGFANRIDVRYSASGPAGPQFLVQDTVGVTILGEGCTRTSPEGASCNAASVSAISAGLADGDDVIVISNTGAEAVPDRYPARIRGGTGNDVIKAGEGEDRLLGDVGSDILAGGAGDDQLSGGEGNDGLIGFGGNDLLAGAGGKDALFGQKGRDMLTGGPGNDVLLARDHRRDRRIDCGSGAKEHAARDQVDPRAIGCAAPRKPRRR